MRTLALTGGTGFIGRSIARQLIDAGFPVRLLARQATRVTLAAPLLTIVEGGLTDTRAMDRLLDGADGVIHVAGVTRGVSRRDFDPVNRDAARDVAARGLSAGATRFLHVSSLAAREPTLSSYAASKRAGEDAVGEVLAGQPLLVLRPPAVYGPGDREMLPILRLMARGTAPVFGDPRARFSLLFVDDMASAVTAWAAAAEAPSGLYEIDDGTPDGYDWTAFASTVQSITGRAVRTRRLPDWLLGVPARFNRLAGSLGLYAPMLTPGKLEELRHPDWVCRAGGPELIPGWQPAWDLREGLLNTPGWRGVKGE